MPKHKTPEELQAETDKLILEAENLQKTPEEIAMEEKVKADEEAEKQKAEVVVEEPKKEEPKVEPVKETPKEEPKKEVEQAIPSPDYKKKFSESSREAQKIVAKNRKLNQAIDQADEVADPTEDELKVEYPDFEFLDETNRKIAKDNFINKKRFQIISQGRQESKKIEKWDEDVEGFVENPQNLIDNPELEGKVDEFKVFANDEANINVPFKVLVGSFLHEYSKSVKPKGKGEMFPSGSGGPNDNPKPKSTKLTVEESEMLRKTDYKKYKELLQSGKIDNTVI